MNNYTFLQIIHDSFIKCLETHSRSNEKLKVLHGAIATDLANSLGPDYFVKSLGYGSGKEGSIAGRYIDKVVDLTITTASKIVAGVAVKFVMNNYSQNSNNYFEGMLGETANIRAGGKPYFQILVLPSCLPYFDTYGNLKSWEKITAHNLKKYIILSKDNTFEFMHSPNKTLIYLIDIPGSENVNLINKESYKKYYLAKKNSITISVSSIKNEFGDNVVINDYESFRNKVTHYIKSI